jgi:hypothetical protein
MTTEDADRDALDWHAAHIGIDLIVNGELVKDDGFLGAKVERLLGRLLDQLDARGRAAYDGEDSYLRRAIACYGESADMSAVDNAYRAAINGRSPLAGELFEPDRAVPLRTALQQAHSARESGHAV